MAKSYTRRLKRMLRDHGCSLLRDGKGDHEIWINPHNQKIATVDGAIKSRHTANETLKQLGLEKAF